MPEKPKATVLVVDDTEASRYAVCRVLRQGNFDVREAATGEEALRLAAEGVDLIILDVNLPDVSGYEVCRRLKASPGTASIPILQLSAVFLRSEDRAEGLEGGADGYLTYPLEPRELIATVRALLRVRQAEHTARAEHELLRVTLSSIGDAVVTTDPGGVVTFVNPVAETLTGWPLAEATGRPLEEVFRIVNEQTRQPAEGPVLRVLREGQVVGLANHSVLIHRDGSERPIEDSAAPIRDAGGAVAGVVLVFRDATQKRMAERDLQQSNEQLRKADRRKDEFLALLAHELRNPLAPIRNAVHFLGLRASDPAVVAQARDMIDRQTVQLTRLVDDLLDASRIALDKVRLRLERLDLTALARSTAEDHRTELEAGGLTLSVEALAGPLWVNGDVARLTQVVGNLLYNAMKFTDPGGRVTLRLAEKDEQAVVTVEDTGIGIAPQVLPRLFEAFAQADASLERSKGGLGLGLAVVKGLVELHGGRARAASAGPGRGSAFTFWLPLDRHKGPDQPERSGPSPARLSTAGARGKVLIIEDGRDTAESLRMLLSLHGFEVEVAHTGPHGIETAGTFAPNAVVCDLGLPGMSGFEVARALRADPVTAAALLICVSGYGQEEAQRKAREAGFDEVMIKPASNDELVRLLGRGRR